MESKIFDTQPLKLSPQDLKNKEFKKSMWGYAPREVIQFLESTARAWEAAQRREKELTEKIRLLNEELTRWKSREQEMQKIREKAMQDADTVRAESTREAQRIFAEVEERASGIRQKTEEWLENVIAEVEETERQKANFMTALKSALDSHYELLRAEQAGQEPLGTKLTHFLKATMGAPPQRAD